MSNTNRTTGRQVRHRRIRAKVVGNATRPRLAVYRSLKHLSAQLIDDESGRTIVGLSTKDLKLTGTKDAATKLGATIAQKAGEQGIASAVFDRAGYRYHGQLKALAEAAREHGLKF